MTLPGAIKGKAWYHGCLSNDWETGTHKQPSLISAFWGGECYYLGNRLATRWLKNLSQRRETRSRGDGLIVMKWMTKRADQLHRPLLFTLKNKYCFSHHHQIKKAPRSGTFLWVFTFHSFVLSFFLVISSKFLRGEIICGDKRPYPSRRAELEVQRETRVQPPSVISTSRTEETSALLVLIKSEIIPLPAFILTKGHFSTTKQSWWRSFPHVCSCLKLTGCY